MSETSRGSHSINPFDVVGVCTDTYRPNSGGKYGAISWYRIINPLEKLGANIEVQTKIQLSPEWAINFAKKGKIWFMKMTDNEGIDFLIDVGRQFIGAKYVLDIDDDPFTFSELHPEYKKLKERMPQVKKMIQMADHIVVSTEALKEVISKENPYVTVIPNAIDPAIWKVENKKRNDGKIHIGWIGSASHFADLPGISPIIQEIIREYPQVVFHLAGMVTEEIHNDRVRHHVGTQGYDEYPEFLASLGLDISIAFVEDTRFNRCKSNIKWLENSMLEIPMVLSNVRPYRESVEHGKTGFLAENKKEWKKYLKLLIENADLREKIGKAAKQATLAKYDIKDQLPKYEKLFTKLNERKDIAVLTAISGGKDTLRDQPEYAGVEYIAFVEPKMKSSAWKTLPVCEKFVSPVMNAKIHKVLAHKYVDHEYIVWIDGNVDMLVDPHELIELLDDADFAFFKHPVRDDVYDEADACVSLGKGNIKELAEQTKYYAKKNIPRHSGLYEMTAFIRRNTKEANEVFEQWWAEICRHSERDQVSLPVVIDNKAVAIIPGSIGKDENDIRFPGNRYFRLLRHRK